jgi:nucleoside phosphorylase
MELDDVEWAGLKDLDTRIAVSDHLHTTTAQLYVDRFVDRPDRPMDELGAVSYYLLRPCLERNLPWAALSLAVAAFGSAFTNLRTVGDAEISDGMLWDHVNRFASQLSAKKLHPQFAALMELAAVRWMPDKSPEFQMEYCAVATGAHEDSGNPSAAARLFRHAAAYAQGANIPDQHLKYLLRAAKASIEAGDSDTAVMTLLPVKEHPKAAEFLRGRGIELGGSLDNLKRIRAARINGEDPEFIEADSVPWKRPLPSSREIRQEGVSSSKERPRVLVVTAVECERDAVLRLMNPMRNRRRILRTSVGSETYYLGKLNEYSIALTMCQKGTSSRDGAALAVYDSILALQPQVVIGVGIAFGGRPDVQRIGDILVSAQVICYEPQRIGIDAVVPRGARPDAGSVLVNRFRNADTVWHFKRPDGYTCAIKLGSILSGDKLVDNPDYRDELLDRYGDAIGGEMEAAGIYAACARRGIMEWIIAKSICDWGDGTKHKKHQNLAASAAASLLYSVLGPYSLDEVLNRAHG